MICFQWDLVCKKNYLAELSQTLFSVGGLVGELMAAVLIDRYGRKWVTIASYVAVASFGSGLAFTQTFISFIVVRTVLAVFVAVSVIITVQ